MLKFFIYSYCSGSKSAKMLANTLGAKIIRRVNSRFQPSAQKAVVNWGASFPPAFFPARVFNKNGVQTASNKLSTFLRLSDCNVNVPKFFLNKEDAAQSDVWPVFCRTVLTGHSGQGIIVSEGPEDLVDAPLYTQYVKRKEEFRVHVFRFGEEFVPFFVQRKAKKHDIEKPNWLIRALVNGFSFVRVEPKDAPEPVLTQSCLAVKALGLDFGAVDVGWNEFYNAAFVFEVNTACGIEERTANAYADMFRAAVAR